MENKWGKEEKIWGKKRRNEERRLGIDWDLKKCRDEVVKKRRDVERRREEIGKWKREKLEREEEKG